MNKSFRFVFIVIFVIHFSQAQGNYRYENFGNRSILLNGNVTGSVEDLGLTYYNPSRLAILDSPNFTISGKAYELNEAKLSRVIGEDTDLRSSDFNAIPSMVSGTFNLKSLENHHFAYSFISRYRSKLDLGYNSGVLVSDPMTPEDNVERSSLQVGLQNNLRDEWIGLTWATKIKDNLAIGASLFLSLYAFDGSSNVNYYSEDEDGITSFNEHIGYNQKTYGLFLKVGTSWTFDKYEMGLNIHLPYLNVYDKARFEYQEVLAGTVDEDLFRFFNVKDLSNTRKTAFGISYGTGIKLNKSKIHLNVEWYNGVDEYTRIAIPENEEFDVEFREELNSVINFGVGAEIYISPSVSGFASFSSDFSAYNSNTNLFDIINDGDNEIDDQYDFWHFGLGLDLKLNWGNFVLGGVYSVSESDFEQPITIPSANITVVSDVETRLKLERYRFIVGLEIPLLTNKLKEIIPE